jgi:hypothetical protein
MESIAGQKGFRRSGRNYFVFNDEIFDRGWFAGYTLLTSDGLHQNPRFHLLSHALKTHCLTLRKLRSNAVQETTVCGTRWLKQATQANRLNLRKATKHEGLR